MARPLPTDAPDHETRAICASPQSEIFTRNTLPEWRKNLNYADDNRSMVRELLRLLLPHHPDELIIVAPLVSQLAASCFLDGTTKSLR
jgi:hypothetical protein